ncbi:MAG: VWA domain-containing protein [Bdellovibrionales bacterium]|nr:VWA domain-containing protein [Bdellovibrionales bacterium]
MRFESWGFLLLLALVPILHRFWALRNRAARVQFPLSVPGNVAVGSPVRKLLLLRYAALGLVIAALARPQAEFRQTERRVDGIDIMLVMDVSASMNIEDLGDRARFDIARETMEGFVNGRSNDRIGFVIFSGEPLTLAPPTLDYGLVLKSIREARSGVLKDGTGIGDGLALAVNRLRNSKAKSRVIILLTDGDNNMGQVDPATAGELAAGYGIRVYTIAIGREGRVRLPIRHRGPFGKEIVTYQYFENALNPELLMQISDLTDAKFYRVTEAQTLERVFGEIDQLERSTAEAKERVRYDERFHWPLKWGLALLLLEQVLALGWWRLLA